ncbi:putative cytosol aminopeptidase [Varanus komodoensis]|nr:putative cytosol aminopeptidase [Varanus komodoensis]
MEQGVCAYVYMQFLKDPAFGSKTAICTKRKAADTSIKVERNMSDNVITPCQDNGGYSHAPFCVFSVLPKIILKLLKATIDLRSMLEGIQQQLPGFCPLQKWSTRSSSARIGAPRLLCRISSADLKDVGMLPLDRFMSKELTVFYHTKYLLLEKQNKSEIGSLQVNPAFLICMVMVKDLINSPVLLFCCKNGARVERGTIFSLLRGNQLPGPLGWREFLHLLPDPLSWRCLSLNLAEHVTCPEQWRKWLPGEGSIRLRLQHQCVLSILLSSPRDTISKRLRSAFWVHVVLPFSFYKCGFSWKS